MDCGICPLSDAHLLTVESDGGSCVCVLSVLEPVQDGGLAAAVQPDHDAVVAAAAPEAHEGRHEGLLAHVRPHGGALPLLLSRGPVHSSLTAQLLVQDLSCSC